MQAKICKNEDDQSWNLKIDEVDDDQGPKDWNLK